MSDAPGVSTTDQRQPAWRPLSAIDRRVLGVLIEKAKTTPEQYPLSLNALRAGCNQKSNRDPVLALEEDQIQPALDRLREAGAAAEVFGSGRVARYRHYAAEWLGVTGAELAVMAELLLRGAQTEGELRGRAARMAPIADVAALRPLLESLAEKGLVVWLSPAGRGQVLSHGLYRPEELEALRRRHGGGGSAPSSRTEQGDLDAGESPAEAASASATRSNRPEPIRAAASPALEGELAALRETVNELRGTLGEMGARLAQCEAQLAAMREELGMG